MRRRTRSTILLLTMLSASGCAARERLRPGLANGPKLGGDTAVESHDVIANGNDSCPDRGKDDPLAHRLPPCPQARESLPPKVVLFSADVIVPPSVKGGLWNLHLEGLPPCEDAPSAWLSTETGPLCAH